MILRKIPIGQTVSSLALMGLLAATLTSSLYAKGTDVRFQATVNAIDATSETDATVTVQVEGFEIPIIVNSDTEIELAGEEVGLAGLSVGDFIKIAAFFSPEGITAEEMSILDGSEGEFRLRGRITAAGDVTGGTLITVISVPVLVTDDTIIERRGSDEPITRSDLLPDMLADARGIFVDPDLVARALIIGSRGSDRIKVELDGTISALGDTMIMVDTDGGGSVPVLITDDTKVHGDLIEGQFVEVKGTLEEVEAELKVVAFLIKVDEDGDGDADDDHRGGGEGEPLKTRRGIRLEPAEGVELEGEVETEFLETPGGQQIQELEIALHRTERDAVFHLLVYIEDTAFDFGMIQANDGGRVKVKFRSHGAGQTPDIRSLLPVDATVADITKVEVVEVLDEDVIVVLTGVFEEAIP